MLIYHAAMQAVMFQVTTHGLSALIESGCSARLARKPDLSSTPKPKLADNIVQLSAELRNALHAVACTPALAAQADTWPEHMSGDICCLTNHE